MKVIYFFPILIFLVLIIFFAIGLGKDPTVLPSTLIDRPLPIFSQQMTDYDFKGRITLLNIWASWCESCQLEHPVLMDITNENKHIAIIGLNYKDDPNNAKAFLSKMGNPYTVNIEDTKGEMGIKLGVYGTPETLIIDSLGIVRYKYVGYITHEVWEKVLLPQIRKLENQNA